jgi:hypothetical protein
MVLNQGVMTLGLKPSIFFLTVNTILVQSWTDPALPPLMSPINLDNLPNFSKLPFLFCNMKRVCSCDF